MLSSATATRERVPRRRSSPAPAPDFVPDAAFSSSSAFPDVGLADIRTVAAPRDTRLARLLHPSTRPQHLAEAELLTLVEEICEQLPIDQSALDSISGRRYVRLFRTAAVEAWIIAWGPSAYLGLHDHGDSLGAFQLISGQLREVSTDLVDREPLRTIGLRPGNRRSLQPRHVHDLWNPSGEPALSVHVYSPPLRSMTFYSDDPATYLAKVRTETENEWPDPDHWAERAIG